MIFSYLLNMQSHPSWVCGLKRAHRGKDISSSPSHPSWVCGLKLLIILHDLAVRGVTPFVGVWIETCATESRLRSLLRHTLRGCVD